MTWVASLLDAADDIARELGWPDASLRHAYHSQLMMLLAQAYVQVFGTHPDHPDWVPHTGPLFPWGAPNHDTIYGFAPLDARGLYRVSGTLGTETVASLMFRRGGANTGQMHGATLGEIDMTSIAATPDGRFSLLLSPAKPERAAEPWYAIPPETTGLLARHVTEVPGQRDGVWTLQRLDRAESELLRAYELGGSSAGAAQLLLGRAHLRDRRRDRRGRSGLRHAGEHRNHAAPRRAGRRGLLLLLGAVPPGLPGHRRSIGRALTPADRGTAARPRRAAVARGPHRAFASLQIAGSRSHVSDLTR